MQFLKSQSSMQPINENEELDMDSPSPWLTKFFFILMIVTNILINVDHGWLPAWTLTIKRDLQIDNAELGFLGSVVYCGLLFGSFISPPIFHYISAKKIILWCTVLNALCLMGFSMYKDFVILCIFRFGIGLNQVLLCIYFPVWIDLYADNSQKTIWLTILQSWVPFGVVVGYGMTAVFDTQFGNWEYSYYVQSATFIFIAFIFWLVPKSCIDDEMIDEDDESENDYKQDEEDGGDSQTDRKEEGYQSDSESIIEEGYQWESSSFSLTASKNDEI